MGTAERYNERIFPDKCLDGNLAELIKRSASDQQRDSVRHGSSLNFSMDLSWHWAS